MSTFEIGAWTTETRTLPTLPNCTEGIIFEQRGKLDKLVLTVQCACCLRTYTDYMINALLNVNHADGGHDPRGYARGTVPYKRCLDCQSNGKYVEH